MRKPWIVVCLLTAIGGCRPSHPIHPEGRWVIDLAASGMPNTGAALRDVGSMALTLSKDHNFDLSLFNANGTWQIDGGIVVLSPIGNKSVWKILEGKFKRFDDPVPPKLQYTADPTPTLTWDVSTPRDHTVFVFKLKEERRSAPSAV